MVDRRGLFPKYVIRRTDDEDGFGAKHDGCALFVLDLTHDRHARVAAMAYAVSACEDRPVLAAQLANLAKNHEPTGA